MTAHLSAVPAPGRAGTAAPTSEGDRGMDHLTTEITKRPWEARAGDVLLRNPEHPEQRVTWTITGKPYSDGWYTHVTYSMPEGGDGVAVCQPGQYITIRGGATYIVEPLYDDASRDDALKVMTCHDRAYIAGFVRQYYPEVFDHALQRLLAREIEPKTTTTVSGRLA